MFKFWRQRKQSKEIERVMDGEYPMRLDLPLRVVYLKKVTVADFLLSGMSLNFFQDKTGDSGRFAKIQRLMKEQAEDKEISQEQRDFIEVVLKIGMKDYSGDLLDIEKIIIFNYIIVSSCEKFADVINPDKTIALNCHYLAKNYGGDPWQYLNQKPDRFLFNLYCLNTGLHDESIMMKRAMKKQGVK